MAAVDLTQYGITGTTEVVYNPSYETLFEEETKPGLTGYEVGKVSELGAVDVFTGVYTGRSPKDKFIVMDENSKDTATNIRTTTIRQARKHGTLSRRSRRRSCQTRSSMSSMLSAARTKTPAWLYASSLKLHGRHTS